MPTFPDIAPVHGRTLLTPHDAAILSPANVFGLPATVAPMGLSKEGIPLSIQILANHGRDLLTIRAAEVVAEVPHHPSIAK